MHPPVVIECKTFGVSAKSTAGSRRRKVQEALWLLIQVLRHCSETRDVRLVLVHGKEECLPAQVALLEAELGSGFRLISVDAKAELRQSIGR